MILLADCPFVAIQNGVFDVGEMERPNCCRTAGRCFVPEAEEPLCCSRHKESEAYRFYWNSSLNGDGFVHVGCANEVVMLRWQYLHFRVPAATESPPAMTLPLSDWQRLQQAVSDATFWALNLGSATFDGFDGARWLIEGRRGDAYHAVHRWCPEGPVHDLGRVLFALAGPPLADVDL
jgi:hypothetical protein